MEAAAESAADADVVSEGVLVPAAAAVAGGGSRVWSAGCVGAPLLSEVVIVVVPSGVWADGGVGVGGGGESGEMIGMW